MEREEAIEKFKALFHEKTENLWEDRKNFRKHSEKYNFIDESYEKVIVCTLYILLKQWNFTILLLKKEISYFFIFPRIMYLKLQS